MKRLATCAIIAALLLWAAMTHRRIADCMNGQRTVAGRFWVHFWEHGTSADVWVSVPDTLVSGSYVTYLDDSGGGRVAFAANGTARIESPCARDVEVILGRGDRISLSMVSGPGFYSIWKAF